MTWARRHHNGYECSSKGDRRFSAFYAKLPDGRSIEEAYQLDVKGYRAKGDDAKLGKGKPPLNGKSREVLWEEYLALWKVWAEHHLNDLVDLCMLQRVHVLTDQFATSSINQARALDFICEEVWAAVNNEPFTL
jgi:hypothetical protein